MNAGITFTMNCRGTDEAGREVRFHKGDKAVFLDFVTLGNGQEGVMLAVNAEDEEGATVYVPAYAVEV